MKKNITESRIVVAAQLKKVGDYFSFSAEKQENLCDCKDPACRCKQNADFFNKISCIFWVMAVAVIEEKEDLLLDTLNEFGKKHLTDFPGITLEKKDEFPEFIN